MSVCRKKKKSRAVDKTGHTVVNRAEGVEDPEIQGREHPQLGPMTLVPAPEPLRLANIQRG